MMQKPKACSTPAPLNKHLRGRKGIHDDNTNISKESPIPRSPLKQSNFGEQQINSLPQASYLSSEVTPQEIRGSRSRSNSTSPNRLSNLNKSDEWEFSSDDEVIRQYDLSSTCSTTCKSIKPIIKEYDPPSTTHTLKIWNKYCCFMLPFCVAAIALYSWKFTNNEINPYNFTEEFGKIQNQFDKQEEDFWSSIRIAIEEIMQLDKPRTIIFLYKNDSSATVNNILEKVSKVAVCNITDCTQEPINIQGSVLNKTEIQEDFGRLISNYREKLKNSGVFIVRNLQTVPGKSAQVFHLFCDEYNPAVNKALFLFTVNVEELPDKYSASSFLKQMLLKIWNDIGLDDKFEPIFTRISGTILNVQPQ